MPFARKRKTPPTSTHDPVAKRPRLAPDLLRTTRLAYHSCVPVPLLSVPVGRRCTTWSEAEAAWRVLGRRGSAVTKRDDGEQRYVGSLDALRSWWDQYDHPRHSLVVEENLWGRYPRAPLLCYRHRFGEVEHGVTVDDASVLVCTPKTDPACGKHVTYDWQPQPPTPVSVATTAAVKSFVRHNRTVLPTQGYLETCWFGTTHLPTPDPPIPSTTLGRGYVVDCVHDIKAVSRVVPY